MGVIRRQERKTEEPPQVVPQGVPIGHRSPGCVFPAIPVDTALPKAIYYTFLKS